MPTPKPDLVNPDHPDISKSYGMRECLRGINWLVENMPVFEPVTTEATDSRTNEPRNLELQTHYGKQVWTDPAADQMRRERCLCYSCEHFNPQKKEANCPIAQTLYTVCDENGVALAVTRCQHFKPSEAEEGKE